MVGVRNVKWLGQITASREEAEGPWQRGIAYKGFSPMVKDRGRTSLTLWLNFDPSLCCLWNSGPERHRHRLGLRKTRAFKFFQPQFCQYY